MKLRDDAVQYFAPVGFSCSVNPPASKQPRRLTELAAKEFAPAIRMLAAGTTFQNRQDQASMTRRQAAPSPARKVPAFLIDVVPPEGPVRTSIRRSRARSQSGRQPQA